MGVVIVTGATGFLGRNLVRRIARDGHDVWALSRSGADVPEASRSLSMSEASGLAPPPDTVLCHVAAQRYDAGRFDMAQSDILTANVGLSNKVYAFCAHAGIKEVRLASSVAVYPAGLAVMNDAEPVDLNATPNRNEGFYGWSKRWAELLGVLYADRYGMATVAFRLSNPYGPFDSTDPAAAHVAPAFVMRALGPGEVFALKGDPEVERDFVFVDDCTEVFARSLDWRGRNDAFNLCRGETTTLRDLARACVVAAAVPKRIETERDFAPAAVRARRSTSVRVREAFGLEGFTTLDAGLAPTTAWYREVLRA